MKSLRVLVLVLCASTIARGADPEFKGIVHSIEHTYGVHHMHIPFLGLAAFFARPAGVHGLKLAVFEGFQPSNDSQDVRRVVESSLGPGWYPFVRVQSKGKHDGETTLIYTYPCGNKLRMMIVNLEPSEAVVLKMELSEHAIEKWLKEPGEQADGHTSHHPRVAED
jgi:hypothetical protein